MTADEQARQITQLSEMIRFLLAGKPAEVQGGVLADLLAIWLAGHHVVGDISETRAMRAELLAMHCAGVRELVEVNAKMMGTTPSL